MKIISLILASGTGSRLYPLSTNDKPKQFLNLFNNEMLIENTLKRFDEFVSNSYVVSLDKYEHFFQTINTNLILEKEKKETAISVYNGLKEIEDNEAIVIQSPSDHYIEGENFKEVIKEGIKLATDGYVVIITANPTYSTSDFGYVKQDSDAVKFIQKPIESIATGLIKDGYRWNTAIYIYQLKKMKNRYSKIELQERDFETIVLKDMEDLKVISGEFVWNDIGDLKRLDNLLNSEVSNYEKNNSKI